jgi:hypothetical protein
MATLNERISAGEICSCFRAKAMFYEVADAGAAEAQAQNFAYVWCMNTQSALGPDGQVVSLETCTPGRGCCTVV